MPRGTEHSRSRRSCIAAIGTLGLVGLAGCSGGDDGTDTSTEAATPTATDTPTDTPTSTTTPTDTATSTPTDTSTSSGPSEADYEEWLSDVPNYEETTDATGQDDVEVLVGAEGGLVFGPPAVRVSTGTTVTWRWTGKGGSHNVVHQGGEFESSFSAEEGHTFTNEFADSGTYRYYCDPHRTRGMKGVVIVE